MRHITHTAFVYLRRDERSLDYQVTDFRALD